MADPHMVQAAMQSYFQGALQNVTTLQGLQVTANIGIGWPPVKTLQALTRGSSAVCAVYDRKTSNDATRWAAYGISSLATLGTPGITIAWNNPQPTTGILTPQQGSQIQYAAGQSSVTSINVGGSAQLTIGGTVLSSDGVGLVFYSGSGVLDAVVYVSTSAATTTAVAAYLSELVNGDAALTPAVSASASNNILTLTNLSSQIVNVQANTGNAGSTLFEVGRRRRELQLVTWSPTEDIRAAIAGIVDASIAGMETLDWPTAADGTPIRIEHVSDYYLEDATAADLYRYDNIFSAEYSVTIVDTLYPVLASVNNFAGGYATTV